jgi:hypothetical protein
MFGAVVMLGVLAFFQPFKHPGILSINTGGQMVVLLVLFGAQYLLIKGGAGKGGAGLLFAVGLIVLTLLPLLSGILLIIRLPKDALLSSADNMIHAEQLAPLGKLLAERAREAMPASLRKKLPSTKRTSIWSKFHVGSAINRLRWKEGGGGEGEGDKDENSFWTNPMHVNDASAPAANTRSDSTSSDDTARAGRLTMVLGKDGAAHARDIYAAAPRGGAPGGARASSMHSLAEEDDDAGGEDDTIGAKRISVWEPDRASDV